MNAMATDPSLLLPGVRRFLDDDKRHFIGGEWVHGSGGETIPVVDPCSGQVFASVPRGSPEDVDHAVRAAHEALSRPEWRDMQPSQRERVMHRFADLIEANAGELAQIEALDVGMPVFAGQFVEVANVLDTLRYMAGWPTKITGRTMDIGEPIPGKRFFTYTRREPVGVVGAIVPWNVPLMIAMWKLAPALATGCTIVLKPSEVTPLATLRLAELAVEAGIPAGVISVVNGYGHEIGQALVEHPLVSKISFTGSTATGKAINHAATDTLKNVTLELGGKSPVILLEDADLDAAVEGIAMGVFGNTGQICVAGSRLYVHRAIHDEVMERLAAAAQAQKVGHSLDPGTQIGPLVSGAHRDKVMGYIRDGLAQGGQAVAGGAAMDGPGFFIQPTVLTGLAQSCNVVQEEIFGPVLTAIPFDDLDEAAALANDTPYGLSSYVWGRDVQQVHTLAGQIRAGQVFVNSGPFPHPAVPMGGVKQSGIGRELGEEAINQYTELKSVVMGMN